MSLTIPELDNAELDVGHISALASITNPSALTATDRAGQVKITWTGLVAQLNGAATVTAAGVQAGIATAQAVLADDARVAAQTAASRIASLRDYGATANYGGSGPTGNVDCSHALDMAMSLGFDVFRIDYVPGETNVAYFNNYGSEVSGSEMSDLVGKTFDIDSRITISVPDNGIMAYPNSAGIRHVRDTRYYMRGLLGYYTANECFGKIKWGNGAVRQTPQISAMDAENVKHIAIPASGLTPLKYAWPNGESAVAGVFSSTNPSDFTIALNADGNFEYGTGPSKPGDAFAVAMDGTDANVLLSAVVFYTALDSSGNMVEGREGIWCAADYTSVPQSFKKTPGVTGSSAQVSGLGFATSPELVTPHYTGKGATWEIHHESWDTATFVLEGRKVVRKTVPGVITGFGFGAYGSYTTGKTVTVSNIVRIRGARSSAGDTRNVLALGDSNTEDRYGQWTGFFVDALQFAAGLRCTRFTNLGKRGETLLQQRDRLVALSSDTRSQYDTLIVAAGVNDCQFVTSHSDFRAALAQVFDLGLSNGMDVIVEVFGDYYTRALSGDGYGFETFHAENGAPYRALVKRVGAEKGVKVVDPRYTDGVLVADYVKANQTDLTNFGDPVVADNIHKTTETNIRRALAFAKAMIPTWRHDLYLPSRPDGMPLNSWAVTSQRPKVSISADGTWQLTGVVDVAIGSRADATAIFQLPAYISVPEIIRVICGTESATDRGSVQLELRPDRKVYLYGCTTSAWVDLSCLSGLIEDREPL